MATETEGTDGTGDAARSKVPLSKRLSFGSNVAVLFGFVLVISSLLVGGVVGAALPFQQAVVAILFAGVFNGLIAVLIGVMAARTGFTSALIYRYSYGQLGAILPNVVMAFTGIVWFAVITNITRDAFVNMTGLTIQSGAMNFLLAIIIGLIFMIPAYKTIRWISVIDWFAAPAILIILVVTMYFALQEGGGISGIVAASSGAEMPLLVGFTVAAGGWIQGNVVISDFARFFKNGKQAAAGLFLTYSIMMVLQYVGAAMGAVATGEWNIFVIMGEFGLLAITFVALFLGSWSTSMGALYGSANMMSAPPIPEYETEEKTRKTAVIVLWVLAMAFAFSNAEQVFNLLLQFLAWLIGPIGITIIIDYWLLPSKQRLYESGIDPNMRINPAAYLAWIVGFPVGFYTQQTFVSLLNGMIVAGIIYYAWMKFALNRNTTPENQIRAFLGLEPFETEIPTVQSAGGEP